MMDQEAWGVAIFFTFIFGLGVGFYAAKFLL